MTPNLAILEVHSWEGHDPDAEHYKGAIHCGDETHDLVCILSVGLRSALGSNRASDVKPELLQKFLRVAYEAAFFFETQLSSSLLAWEAANQPFRVFPVT